jgi:hypothetical protein
MSLTIRVRPMPALRRQFARWAVAQEPKVRTLSTVEFAVPAALFCAIPEELLAGALVDRTPYTPPPQRAPQPQAAGEEKTAEPGERLPDVDPSAYPQDAVPLDAAPAAPDPEQAEAADVDAEGGGEGQAPAAPGRRRGARARSRTPTGKG